MRLTSATAIFVPIKHVDEAIHVLGPIEELVGRKLHSRRVCFDNILHVRLVRGKHSRPFVGTNAQQANDEERGNSRRQVQADAAAENQGAECVAKVGRGVATHQLERPVGEGISGNDEEQADGGRSLVPEADKGQLEEVVVGLAGAPALGNDKGLIKVVAEEDKQGGEAAHAVEVGRGRELGRTNLLAGVATLQEAGHEKEAEADEQWPPRRRPGVDPGCGEEARDAEPGPRRASLFVKEVAVALRIGNVFGQETQLLLTLRALIATRHYKGACINRSAKGCIGRKRV